MRKTTNNRPTQQLFSLKWRALFIFSLLLLGINSFSTLYFSRNLLSQFELERKSSYAKQVKELDGMVRQSSATLQVLADIAPSMSEVEDPLLAGNIRNVAQAFGRRWQSLQLGASVDVAQIYSTRSELIQSWKSEDIELPDPELIQSHVQEVNKTERPLTFLDCTNKCVQLAVSPMLAKDRNSGVIVLGTTLAAGIVSFKDISGVDIGILNVGDNGWMVTGGAARNIAHWRARVSALTNLEQNLPLLQSVAAKQNSPAGMDMGMRETFNGHEYEIHLLPIEKFAVRGNAYFVLIDDITQNRLEISKGIWRNITVGLAGLILSELILLLILWGPLSRLRRTADVLPLLAQNAFDQVRQAVSSRSRKGRYKDEFDMLDDTLVAVSRQLENLQAEVAKRTADLSETNSLLGNLNEELEQKVKARTWQLLEAQAELVRKEKLAVLGQVAGSVGHELRNPLGVMSNAVYFLQTVLADADDSVKEYLEIIKNEITGSERIVSDLLDSVRTKPPHPEAVGVREAIKLTLGKLTVPPSVSVKLDIPETLPALRVDAQQIHQVFRNLISNGVEAMPEGGILAISAVDNKPDGTVTVSVRDSGIGMTAEQLGKLFQPLFTTKARGIGLGLVVVKNLTQANGGSVEVQSKAGKGTTFTVTLPAGDANG